MFISVKIPVDKIKAVADVTKTALDGYREIDKTIAELPVVSKEMDGQRAVDAWEAKLAQFAAQKTQLLEDAKAKIEPLIADYQADIDEQTTPSGDLIQKNSDFLLFERGFIKAEVIKYQDYIDYGSETAVKEAGKMHIEGKDYVMQDGDIVVFRFNV